MAPAPTHLWRMWLIVVEGDLAAVMGTVEAEDLEEGGAAAVDHVRTMVVASTSFQSVNSVRGRGTL